MKSPWGSLHIGRNRVCKQRPYLTEDNVLRLERTALYSHLLGEDGPAFFFPQAKNNFPVGPKGQRKPLLALFLKTNSQLSSSVTIVPIQKWRIAIPNLYVQIVHELP
jgi:hypothetical protein